MSKLSFTVEIDGSEELDEAFQPIQEAVLKAYENDDSGAVFCQLEKSESDGSYRIKGRFYPREKAMIIQEALKKANQK